MISFAVFVFGLAIGSFVNALIYRMGAAHGSGRASPRSTLLSGRESVLHGRSYCPRCKHPLAWYDLIPLVSFALLKGTCRYCKRKISLQYPLVELATALVFVALAWSVLPKFSLGVENLMELSFPKVLELLYLWAVASGLLVIFVYDLKHYLIPDKVLYPAILVSSIWYLVSSIFFDLYTKYEILNTIYSALGAGAFFWAIHAVSRGAWMGFGDVKLAFLLGLFLGWPSVLVALFFAFCLGAVVGVVLVLLKKKGLKSEVPFAPFLIMGTAIAFFFGSSIVHFYMNLIL